MIEKVKSAGIIVVSIALASGMLAQRPPFDSFEVAVIKPVALDDSRAGRYIRMQSAHSFRALNQTVNGLIAAAYDLHPKMLSGGPAWADSDIYDIVAKTPGDLRPTYDDQMRMLRQLLTDRFHLQVHRVKKEFSVYLISIAPGGPKLKTSTAPPDEPYNATTIMFGAANGGVDHTLFPARNITMAQFASSLQRAILDRPVVDNTGLTARYDFDLEWTPDESQFGGKLPPGPSEPSRAALFPALRDQLGLRVEGTRASLGGLIVDRLDRPSEN